MFRRILLFVGLSTVAITAAQAATRPILYVANSQGDDVTVIDLPTQKVLTTIKVGPIVHGVCAPADGRHAYVTIESEHALKVVDTKTNTVTDTIQLPGQPNECAATSDGHYVVVPLLAPQNSAVVVDTTQNKIVKTFEVRHPHNCFTPEGGSNTIVYCEARDNFFIRRIDLSKMEITNDVKVAGDPRPFIVTPDEKTLYT
ncbi:MAG TPA: YncE family protein, partial [Rhizomicrobium sp.]|nr:YncE family protein [Rhizomicrobium sp.]